VKVTLKNGIKAMICRLFTLPQMSARLKPTSIDNAKHIVTAVLKAGPIVFDASSAGVSSTGSTWGGIRLISSEPSGIASGSIPSPTIILFLGVDVFPFSAVDFFSLLVVGFFPLSVVAGFPLTVVEFFAVAVLLAEPRFPLDFPDPPPELPPPPPFFKSLLDSSVAV